MKLYLTHSSGYDYKKELYEPLKATIGKDHDIFFPHDEHNKDIKSKSIIPTCDIVLAEVSQPSTGQGIELGWADASDIPIICFYRSGSKVSSALRFITSKHIEYSTETDMIQQLRAAIES